MLPTPDTSHVSFNTIYEPAEDSYFFLDTLSSTSETAWLTSRFSSSALSSPCESESQSQSSSHPPTPNPNPTSTSTTRVSGPSVPLAVEIGTGSGILVAFLAAHARTILGSEVVALGVDANRHACIATRETVEKAISMQRETATATTTAGQSIYTASVTGDLSGMLRYETVDILLCNPPYVPSETVPDLPTPATFLSSWSDTNPSSNYSSRFEQENHLLRLTYDGGTDGMEVTFRLLRQLNGVLSRRGVAYILLCARNRPEQVREWIRGLDGGGVWRVEVVGRSGRRAGWERLEIVRIWRVDGEE